MFEVASVKVYLKAYADAVEARRELGAYFRFYNNQGPHRALGYWTPPKVFHGNRIPLEEESKTKEGPPERELVSLPGAAGLSLNCTLILSN